MYGWLPLGRHNVPNHAPHMCAMCALISAEDALVKTATKVDPVYRGTRESALLQAAALRLIIARDRIKEIAKEEQERRAA